MIRQNRGITLIELLVVIAVVSIIALLAAPQLGLFKSVSDIRACATDIIQNMRLARAMAIKENREYLIVFDTANGRYLIGHDGNGDNDLTTADSDTFGICKDTDNDRLPEGDVMVNGVPACVKAVTLTDYGNISFGVGSSGSGDPPVDFSGDQWIGFQPDSSVDHTGSVYIQNVIDGAPEESYHITVSNFSGSLDVQKWLKGSGGWKSWQ